MANTSALYRELAAAKKAFDKALAEIEARLDSFGLDQNDVDEIEALLALCKDQNIPVSPDDYIDEAGLALILRRSRFTIRNWRLVHRPVPFRKVGNRIEYSLRAVAGFRKRSVKSVD